MNISKKLKDYVEFHENSLAQIQEIRVENEFPAETSYFRNNADVDYARILYSASCRRLQGKMQLFIPKSEVFYRNRLTHSHEVAQIAKILAKRLELKDILTVQACSLAHDIGNPPFGHAGEIALSSLGTKLPYEGNAQSFRILHELEERHYKFFGLNLTLRTMLGIVKYHQMRSFKDNEGEEKINDKFLYDEDYELVGSWLEKYNINHKTIDCEIMDLSDEIAYAVHDLEDALKLKYFTIDELIYEFSVCEKFLEATKILEKQVNKAKSFAKLAREYSSSEEYSMLFRKELTSNLTSLLITDIDLVEEKLNYKKYEKLVKGLKKLTFRAIKRQPDIILYENQGNKILKGLFEVYNDDIYNKNLVLLPNNYRNLKLKERKIKDYIGGMMDLYAISQYEKYFGPINDKGIYGC
ncbi:dNTP triphosphohydrolase [Chryseobacterium nematophagum]|uniref:DNTP triphosphohydrolase n=1 Tax=Chryseobacterium nematophagum TaxID=2305228 RepID=A0A3M7LCD7_9FLAO|nr:dNTP triphosphohydrolase [Chryseobacterium nematophagum]RMZ59889.1 dNTP triphosphohydrolase [Chryseobacterium nematophagum]